MRHKSLLTAAFVVALAFTACGKKADEPAATPTPVVETTPEATEEPTPEITEEAPEVTENEENSIPSDDNLEQSEEIASNETLDAVKTAIQEQLGGDYLPDMSYPADSVEELFGVKSEWYDAAIAEGPMMSVHVDKLLAFHATEGNVENIANALNTYRDTLITGTLQYPMNLLKIQGSVVETVGDYVIFSLLGMVDDMAYDEDSQFIDAYKEINESVIATAKGIIEQ